MTSVNPSRPAGEIDAAQGFRSIPSVQRLVERLAGTAGAQGAPTAVVTDVARAVIDEFRAELGRGGAPVEVDALEMLVGRASVRLEQGERAVLEPVINATGIIIHTGLGRAPLAETAARAAAEAAGAYVPVEINLATGERGKRSHLVREILCGLTGAEAATVVNNTAAALMLVLSTVARDRRVIVSRGELIEIGGSFRLPEIMKAGGAILREVGTTNRTRIADYERAIDEDVAALMKVHTSNYRIEGFTEAVGIRPLVDLGRRRGVTVIDDIGSGALRPTAEYGWPSAEPDATTSIGAGADLVLFSGDKLLGGPQAGIILGRRSWIDAIEANPMMRAVRVDKVTLAALAETLRLHRDPAAAARSIPVLARLTVPVDEIRRRGAVLAERLRALDGIADVTLRETRAHPGGGSMPSDGVPSAALAVRAARLPADDLATRLRTNRPAVVSRVREDAVWLDLRTILDDQDAPLFEAIRAAVD